MLAASIMLNAKPKLVRAEFGHTPDGAAVQIYTLTNKNAIEARITNYGGIVVSLNAPDRNGAMADIVLGFDSFAAYLANPGPPSAALIRRFGTPSRGRRFS